jgi:DNA-binding MarR family transcriptional regulator
MTGTPQPAPAPVLAACNCVSLRSASRRISQFYDSRLAPAGIRATQYAMLALIGGAGGLPIHAIAARLEMDRTTTGQNLRPLERDGLVILERSADDGRSRIVRLTAEGQSRLQQAVPLWQEAQRLFEAWNGASNAADMRQRLGALKLAD